MKRTPLQRRKALEQKAALCRASVMRARRRRKRRESAWRSPDYLRWVKSLPCCHCSRPADDAHHLIGEGGLGGAGTKAPDQFSMPVCRRCHDEIHATPELWPQQWEWVERTLGLAVHAGWSGWPEPETAELIERMQGRAAA